MLQIWPPLCIVHCSIVDCGYLTVEINEKACYIVLYMAYAPLAYKLWSIIASIFNIHQT